MQGDRLTPRPAGHLALGHLGHEPGEALHLLAVEGGQHQLALAQVRPLVEQDHRVLANHRLEDPCALARMQHLGGRREQLPRHVRVGDVHERRRLEELEQ